MLRKAYAYVLLKWRGNRLPTLAELEAQSSFEFWDNPFDDADWNDV